MKNFAAIAWNKYKINVQIAVKMEEEEYLVDAITGRKKKPTLKAILNKKKIDKFEVDMMFNGYSEDTE